ncbi:ankyrin repeat protein [Euphorbia peplus]|nr:ankyrin repeat protein [Euphorbia peplus]
MSVPSLLNPQTPKFLLPFHFPSSPNLQNLRYPRKLSSFPPSLQSSFPIQTDDFEEHVIGDCLVFEEGAFDDPYLDTDPNESLNSGSGSEISKRKGGKLKGKVKDEVIVAAENLVPDKWREVQAEINITKKERRKIAQEMEFGSKVEKKKKGYLPIRSVNLEEYQSYREAKMAQLKPLVLDNPTNFGVKEEEDEEEEDGMSSSSSSSQRVTPRNPRWAVYGKGFDDVAEFFERHYEPGAQKPQGPRKMFTKEEKALLNKKIPDLSVITSKKWIPLHSLAASGEFYLVDALLKHNVDINAVNLDGMSALSKAILCRKQAITNYLLRESASPFVRDEDGATLLHYAVQTANLPAIKILLLYNVDINLQDNDGWTPLHVAVQARRTDVIKLLLLKGADRTLKNKDGLSPVDLCLYSGRSTRTYEILKLLKEFPKKIMKKKGIS